MHFMACKAALAQVMGAGADGGGDMGGDMGAPPPGAGGPPGGPPPGSPSPSPSPSAPPMPPPPMGKMEEPAANGGKGKGAAVPDDVKPGHLGKSEAAALRADLADAQAQIVGLTKAVELTLGQPIRKAVTGMAFAPKPDGTTGSSAQSLTKAEVQAKLGDAIKDPSLKKSDRERIVSYSLGHIDFEAIKDLVK